MNKLKLTLLILFVQTTLIAQPQWKFHIAFEDATGAKDTIWMIWDSTATLGVDPILGETAFPFNYSTFNAWVYNYDGDSTKTMALPYSYFPSNWIEVRAFNYQYPLIVKWDTTLLHAAFLPQQPQPLNVARIDNNYFFLVNNSPPNHYFDMFLSDSVFAPYFNWGSQSQFPMSFNLTFDPVGIEEFNSENKFKLYPLPASETININTTDKIKAITIKTFDLRIAMKISTLSYKDNIFSLNISELCPAIYLLEITNSKNQIFYEKFIKN